MPVITARSACWAYTLDPLKATKTDKNRNTPTPNVRFIPAPSHLGIQPQSHAKPENRCLEPLDFTPKLDNPGKRLLETSAFVLLFKSEVKKIFCTDKQIFLNSPDQSRIACATKPSIALLPSPRSLRLSDPPLPTEPRLAVYDKLVVNAYHESWPRKAWFDGSTSRCEEIPTCLHLTDAV